METTPNDLRQQQFEIKFRGYNADDVEVFRELAANALEEARADVLKLTEENRHLSERLKSLVELEETLKAAVLEAQKNSESTIGVAKKEKIKTQICSLAGGATDGRPIHLHKAGVPTIYLGVPTRYIHTHGGILHSDDYDAAVKRVVAVCRRLDSAALKKILPKVGQQKHREYQKRNRSLSLSVSIMNVLPKFKRN